MHINDVIQRLAPGQSFVDIGGLWGTANERVSTALLAGAASATMADIVPLGHALWQAFEARCAGRGVSGYRMVQADLNDPLLPDALGRHDVVHCSGVIYHCPDPYHSLRQIARVARRHVLIGSTTVPERIENEAGVVEFGEGRLVAVPALSGRAKAVVAQHFADAGIEVHNINMAAPHPWRWPGGAWNYGPWWWLWSAGTLRGMAEAAGLHVREVFESWPGLAHYLICEVRAG